MQPVPGVPAHGCKYGHYHYFEYHQSPPPKCFCRLVRRTGCLDQNGDTIPPTLPT
jgi:hypothetical protein